LSKLIGMFRGLVRRGRAQRGGVKTETQPRRRHRILPLDAVGVLPIARHSARIRRLAHDFPGREGSVEPGYCTDRRSIVLHHDGTVYAMIKLRSRRHGEVVQIVLDTNDGFDHRIARAEVSRLFSDFPHRVEIRSLS